MSEESTRQGRMAEAVRQVVTRRERAPRSPRLARALKRLIWRYSSAGQEEAAGVPDGECRSANDPE